MKTPYSNFAKYYDAMVGITSSKANFLRKIIHEHCKGAETLAELGCGTGTLLAQFEKEFKTYGVDSSHEMLTIAASKLTQSKLIHQDIRNFELPDKVSIIMCVFDTINHLTDLADWEKLFQNVSHHLQPNGVFIFDINTQEMLEKKSKSGSWAKKIDDDFVLMGLSKSDKIYNWNIDIFQRINGENYEHITDCIPEVSFTVAQIKDRLAKCFTLVSIKNELGEPWSSETERPYFVCLVK
jgi:SAM-dependent methyltransferase